jgi:hypothetical protein
MVRLIRKLNSERRSVIAISRDLHDVALRLGCKVAEFNREEVNASDLVAAITGIRSRLAAA